MVKITIGLPFLNPGHRLAYAIQSVLAQTIQDWELLLVDDGSTDESVALASSLADKRIRLIRDGRNLGLPARLNQIAELASGEILVRMDADDLMHPTRIKRLVDVLDSDPTVDVAWSA